MTYKISTRGIFLFFLSTMITLNTVYAQSPYFVNPGQYKKIARETLSDILEGNIKNSVKTLRDSLNSYPDDPEIHFVLTYAYSKLNNHKEAIAHFQKAVEHGVPTERFFAGSESIFESFLTSDEFKNLDLETPTMLIHGPMLGDINSQGASFWIRTRLEVFFQVQIRPVHVKENKVYLSKTVKTSKNDDFTAVSEITGLMPDTHYKYQLIINDSLYPQTYRFKTFPRAGENCRFTFGFGGGAGYTPKYERIWNTISAQNTDAFLLLGDNVYIDHPDQPAVQRYCYYRRQSRPEFRQFITQTPVFAIWDDHDFGDNDSWGGPKIDQPEWKIPVWKLFKSQWANPYYGGSLNQPGCWFDFSVGDVDIFMLDCRYYREDPNTKNPSMLGKVQKKWLFDNLKNSTGVFKIIASSVPWAHNTKPGSPDTWDGYSEEREEIFTFIEENRIDGVILISADRHRSDVRPIIQEKGYDLYDFMSSRLSNLHRHTILPGALFGYNKKCSFATMTFDTTSEDPSMNFKIINIDGEMIHSLTLYRSQLMHQYVPYYKRIKK